MFLETINNEPLVSHIVIAQNTQRQPIAIQNLIVSNKADFEEFGTLHFKNEGVVNNGKGELLERVGKRSDDKTAKRWLHGYDGIYWRANILNAVPTYSYSLIEE